MKLGCSCVFWHKQKGCHAHKLLPKPTAVGFKSACRWQMLPSPNLSLWWRNMDVYLSLSERRQSMGALNNPKTYWGEEKEQHKDGGGVCSKDSFGFLVVPQKTAWRVVFSLSLSARLSERAGVDNAYHHNVSNGSDDGDPEPDGIAWHGLLLVRLAVYRGCRGRGVDTGWRVKERVLATVVIIGWGVHKGSCHNRDLEGKERKERKGQIFGIRAQ